LNAAMSLVSMAASCAVARWLIWKTLRAATWLLVTVLDGEDAREREPERSHRPVP